MQTLHALGPRQRALRNDAERRQRFRAAMLRWFCGALPVAGYLSALLAGIGGFGGSHMVVPAGVAVALNLWLHLDRRVRGPSVLGFVTGATAFLSLAYLPQLPVIAFALLIGLGFLALAPYLALFGVWRIGRKERAAVQGDASRFARRIAFAAGVTIYPALAVAPDLSRIPLVGTLWAATHESETDRTAALTALRGASPVQQSLVWYGARNDADDGPWILGKDLLGDWFGLPDHATNWIGRRLNGASSLDADAVRTVIQQVHGVDVWDVLRPFRH